MECLVGIGGDETGKSREEEIVVSKDEELCVKTWEVLWVTEGWEWTDVGLEELISEMGWGMTKQPVELKLVSWESNGNICSWNITSRETKIYLEAKSYSLYPLELEG